MTCLRARFCGCSDENTPSRTHSIAPGKIGTSKSMSVTQRPSSLALSISARWPSRPKPVTSVHAVALCSRASLAGTWFDSTMVASAESTQTPLASRRMCAAKMTPVPIGLVSTRASPSRRPPLVSAADWPPLGSVPLTERPRDSSVPSHEWPPTRAQSASRSVALTPAIICVKSFSTIFSSAKGTTAMAMADMGCAHMAWQSLSAWLAAMRPNT
mmetsp:Transcript_18090/g.51920  ORF Transcript_18090/g.51920 Transcript_18090/m.51920 type:complete len:214 (-) Transcript_18090:866-1507(-)